MKTNRTVGIGRQDLRGDGQDVVVPLPLEEPGDGAEGDVVVGQPQLAADLVAGRGGFRNASTSIPL